MKITYKEKEIELKYSFRALMIYENILNKSFKPTSLSDIIVFFYSCAVAQLKEETIDFDEFVDYLDERPELVEKFSEWLLECITAQDKKVRDVPEKKEKKNGKKTKEKEEDPNQ